METPLWRLDPVENDIESLKEMNESLRRALCAMERKYIRTKKELDTTADLLGNNKNPLPFLRFPREIRDQIYTLALVADGLMRIEPQELRFIGLEDNPQKPATPSLLYLNRQLSQEAAKILYSKNKFTVTEPGEFLRFEQQIGKRNRDFVRSLQIKIFNRPDITFIPDPEYLASYDFKPFQSHWARALIQSELKDVETLEVEVADFVESSDSLAIVSPILRQAIVQFFRQGSNEPQKSLPRLELRGFRASEVGNFTGDLEVFASLKSSPSMPLHTASPGDGYQEVNVEY